MAADFPFVSIPWTRETLKLFFGVELSRLGHGSVLERNIDLLTGVSWASKGNLLAGTLALSMDPSASEDENIPLDERTGAKVTIDATKKWAYPAIALPPKKYLEKVAGQWSKYGLPEVDSSWVFRGVPED